MTEAGRSAITSVRVVPLAGGTPPEPARVALRAADTVFATRRQLRAVRGLIPQSAIVEVLGDTAYDDPDGIRWDLGEQPGHVVVLTPPGWPSWHVAVALCALAGRDRVELVETGGGSQPVADGETEVLQTPRGDTLPIDLAEVVEVAGGGAPATSSEEPQEPSGTTGAAAGPDQADAEPAGAPDAGNGSDTAEEPVAAPVPMVEAGVLVLAGVAPEGGDRVWVVDPVQGAAEDAHQDARVPETVFLGAGQGLPEVLDSALARHPRAVLVALDRLDRIEPAREVLSGTGWKVEATLLQATRLAGPGPAAPLAAVDPVILLQAFPAATGPRPQEPAEPDG